MINPITHTASADGVARYQVEPYVVAGDVYSQAPHAGRGGWTWYSGSAGWLYRIGLETILGFRRLGDELSIEPCIPPEWRRFTINYRYGSATYLIIVENPQGAERGTVRVELDGQAVAGKTVRLTDDGREHQIRVAMAEV
jgi:cyclic beta-1,2-glucan synthetase